MNSKLSVSVCVWCVFGGWPSSDYSTRHCHYVTAKLTQSSAPLRFNVTIFNDRKEVMVVNCCWCNGATNNDSTTLVQLVSSIFYS